jgi:hypothetical protein
VAHQADNTLEAGTTGAADTRLGRVTTIAEIAAAPFGAMLLRVEPGPEDGYVAVFTDPVPPYCAERIVLFIRGELARDGIHVPLRVTPTSVW